LTIIAAIGLRQLTLSKNIARTNAKRKSFRLAAEQIAYYFENIIPLVNALDAAIENHNVVFFAKSSVEIDGNTMRLKSTATPDDLRGLLKIVPEVTSAYNALEAFSIYFTSGVADERVAFSAVGTTYCNTVRQLLPDIVDWWHDQQYCIHILQLFLLWNARFEKQKLAAEKRRIEAKLGSATDKFVKPIGT
jgi:hypothetical protein